mmetsp:Transcript_29308/g.47219  ORF Transcript_29308/g.47219 Transcript_29308/m.47219 type:complete len:286 (-) Transcript_29308:51-908(-)
MFDELRIGRQEEAPLLVITTEIKGMGTILSSNDADLPVGKLLQLAGFDDFFAAIGSRHVDLLLRYEHLLTCAIVADEHGSFLVDFDGTLRTTHKDLIRPKKDKFFTPLNANSACFVILNTHPLVALEIHALLHLDFASSIHIYFICARYEHCFAHDHANVTCCFVLYLHKLICFQGERLRRRKKLFVKGLEQIELGTALYPLATSKLVLDDNILKLGQRRRSPFPSLLVREGPQEDTRRAVVHVECSGGLNEQLLVFRDMMPCGKQRHGQSHVKRGIKSGINSCS